MRLIHANQIDLAVEVSGAGEPLVLVHGGWSDRDNWLPVVPGLSRRFTVARYDRRGHGASTRPQPQGTRRDQEDDLAALIERLALGPAHVAGTSFGGSIALGLATRRPDLVRSVVAHEPPLLGVAAGDPELERRMVVVAEAIGAVRDRVVAGDAAGAARRFVEDVALGPGSWALLPEALRATMVDGAATFVAEQEDPAWALLDRQALAGLDMPLLLTGGDASPPWFAPVVARVAEAAGSGVHVYRGAGHAPHVTHPERYVEDVTAFLAAAPVAG